jgi:beta-lactamase class A
MLNFGKRRRTAPSQQDKLRRNAYRQTQRTDSSMGPRRSPSVTMRERPIAGQSERPRPSVATKKRPLEPVSSNSKRRQPGIARTLAGIGAVFTDPQRPGKITSSGLAFLYGTRLLILGIGIGVIAGTMLSMWDPANRTNANVSQPEKVEQVVQPPATLDLNQEIVSLKTELQRIMAQPTDLISGAMVVDLDTQNYLDINATTAFAAASTIKFPILVAFFQDVDAGKIRLDEPLTMRQELVATEAGEMQYLPVGSQFPALEVATKMITVSDNTATNMIIDRLGGKDALNQRFQSWGLSNTVVHNLLPDLQGTNTSSPKDMAMLLGVLNKGQLISMRSHERVLEMMRNISNRSMLPQGISEKALIAHKTGDIGSSVGDVGIIDLPNGKRYLITAIVKRPHNDERAIELIQQISKLTYQHFEKAGGVPPMVAPSVQPSPSNSQGASPLRSKVALPTN